MERGRRRDEWREGRWRIAQAPAVARMIAARRIASSTRLAVERGGVPRARAFVPFPTETWALIPRHRHIGRGGALVGSIVVVNEHGVVLF